jgi:c-di-GMP-binding flagellar brake protein YcgR
LSFAPISKSEERARIREMEKEGTEKAPRFGTVNFERRKYPRFSLDLPVEYWESDSESHPSRTGNVSEGGILLYLPEELEIGKNLRMRLFIDTGLDFISIEALVEVVWKGFPIGDKGEHRIGVKFIDISEKDMANLKNFLNSLTNLRTKPKLDIPPRLLSALGIKTPETAFEAFQKKINPA